MLEEAKEEEEEEEEEEMNAVVSYFACATYSEVQPGLDCKPMQLARECTS